MNNFAQDLIESCFLQIGRLPRHEKLKLEEGRKKHPRTGLGVWSPPLARNECGNELAGFFGFSVNLFQLHFCDLRISRFVSQCGFPSKSAPES